MPNDSASTNKVNDALRLAIQALLGDRPVAYHAVLAKALNSATAGILLSQFLYWTPRSQHPDGWVWKTQVDIQDETALTRFEQEGARKVLRLAGVLEEKRAGVPARLYFRVDMEGLTNLLSRYQGSQQPHPPTSPQPTFSISQDAENQQSRMRSPRSQARVNSANLLEQKPLTITETTPENTAETTNYISSPRISIQDLSSSKFERANAQKRREPDEPNDKPKVSLEPPQPHRGFEALRDVANGLVSARDKQLGPLPAPAATLMRATKGEQSRRQPAQEADLRLAIRPYLEQYAEELGDEAPLSSTVTQAVHLYAHSRLTIDGFIQQLQQAHRETQRRSGSIRKRRTSDGPGPVKNKMPFYFAMLRDYLGLKEQVTEPVIMPTSTTPRSAPPPQPLRRTVGGPLVPVIRRAQPLSEDDRSTSAPQASFSTPRAPSNGLRAPRRRERSPSESEFSLGFPRPETEPSD